MKRNSIYKKALVLVAVLALALILLVGCGKTTTPDDPNLNQFVKPDTGNQQQSTTVKTNLSGSAAKQMLLTSITNAKTTETRYITFSLAPYVYVEKEGKTDKYTVRIKGSIDTEDSDKSVMTFEVIKESADMNTVVLGIYALNGDMYIDFNDYASGKAVHRYYVSDSDISYVVGVFKQILNQLQLEEFFKEYDLGSLFGDSGVSSLISQILGTSNSDKLTIFNLLLSLIADNGCYSVTNADGSIDLVMPTKLNALFGSPELMKQLKNILDEALKNQSDIIKGVVNLLVGDILSGQKTLNTTLVANISNNRFQKMALNVISSKGNLDKTVELGVGELSKSDNFAKEVKDGMPTLVKADRKNYSFTTLSADIDVELNVAEQKYSVKNIDDALGGAIAKALESITGTSIYNNNDAVQILSPLKISLQLKLRAEINLKNNSKSRAVIELNGKDKDGNPRTYLGLYYIGADKAIYADMSGLGGGKAMIPNVDLNQILKALIASKIPEIPSIMDLIKGNGSGASDGDVLNEGLLSAVQTVMDKGELVVTHYGFASEDNESAAVEETANLDIMALLACVNIVMGTDTPITVERISADLTKDVIAGLMGKLGLKLPVDNLKLDIYQTREDYPQGEEGWKIAIDLNMAKKERGQIANANLGVFLNYGNPDPTLNAYIAGKNLKSVINGGEFVDAGKLKYDGTTLDFDLWASVGLDIDLSLYVSKGSVLDLSPLGKMLYGLALKVQSPDDVDVDLNLKINANVNVMKLVNAIKNNTGVKDILDAIDARIDVHANAGEKELNATLLLQAGKYIVDEKGTYKCGIYDLAEKGYNGTKFSKNADGTFKVDKDGAYKFVTDEFEKVYYPILEGENYLGTKYTKLESGVLYLYSADGELRNYKINILDALGGNFKLFGKDTSAGSTALASGDGDNTEGTPDGEQKPEEKAEFDILGLLVANLAGITISNERLEVAIANTLLSGLLKGLGVDTKVVDKLNFKNDNTGISLEYDGLNLSKLYLKANVGIQQGESANMALGLGLGHIYLSLGRRDLKTLGVDVTKAEYHDLLNGGNIFLGLGAEIDVFLDKDVYKLEEIVGALVADFAIGTKINVQDVIQGGLRLNVVADVDISSAPKSNDTRLLIELKKVSDNSVFLGLYYDQKTTTLYLNTVNGTIIQPVALKFDLIALLEGLINKGDGTASADIDLSELNPIILLGNKGVQIKVMTGVMKLLVGVLVGDMTDYIEYNPGGQSYKYYAYDANADYDILKLSVDNKLYQRNVDKYTYDSANSENPFTLDNGYVGDDFFVKAKTIVKEEDGEEVKEQTYFYVLKEQAVAQGIDKHCQKNDDGTLKEFVNSGRKFTLIDASNKDIYASAPKYLQSEYKRADTLMFDMDKDAIDFKAGFIKAYNKTSGFTTYVKVDASNQDVALYELFTNGYTMKRVFGENGKPTGATTEMRLKLPELGASIVIGQINDGDVSITGKDDTFSGIGIGVFIMRNGATEPFSFVKIAEGEVYTGDKYVKNADGKYVKAENGEYKKVNHTVANLGIKLGNIQLSEKKFKNEYGKTFEEYIDSLSDEKNFKNSYKFEKIAEDEVYTGTRYNLVNGEYVKAENGEYKKVNTVVADKIEDLTVYVNVEAAIELGADKTTGETKWEIGGLLSGLLKGNENVSNELAEFLKKLLIKFNVAEEIRDVIGLRISGNIQLGALMGGGDAKNIIANLLRTADLAVEITDKAPWDKSAEQVVGLYVTDKTVYINVNGKKTITNTKLKIGVDQILGMIKGGSGSATASADLGVDGILKVINDIVKEISIYRNDTESGMTITLGKNMIGAILKVVADIDGVDLQLVEENSKIEINTNVTEDNPYILGVSVGIAPVILGVKLGGLQIGLAKNDNVLKNLKGKEGEYKGLDELDQISLDVEIGLDLGLKQGMFPIGTLLSGILQAMGKDLEFPLNLDVQKAIDLDLRVRVAGNLNLKDFGKSDIMLQVRNDATGKEKTILGLYFTTDANGKPCLYVETQFMSQGAPVKSKIENFDLIGSLLGKTVEGVVKVLGGKVDGSGSALASGDPETSKADEVEILLELASKSLDVKIAEETVKGLLKAFIGKDAVGEDILEIINNLGLSASLSVDLKDENKPLLEVVATCSYLNLGVLVDTVKLSTNKLEIFGDMFKDEAEWTKAQGEAKSALGVQFGVAIDYDLSNGKHSLDAILKNVASSIIEKDAKMATVGSILKALTADAIIKNTRGTIGINVVLNVLPGDLSTNLMPAATALYNFVMGKIGGQTESTDGQNILDALKSIEALIKVDLNGNPIFVSIKGGIVHISLSAVGGANYSASLENIIKQLQKKPGNGSSALASDDGNGNGNGNENQKKEPDFVLINMILQNLLSSTSIGESGLDVALAPDVLQFLLSNLVAKKLGETFGFDKDVLAMFKLSDPYVKYSTETVGKSIDDLLYMEKVDVRYVNFNETFKSQQGKEILFFDTTETDVTKAYKTLYRQSPDGSNVFVLYTGGKVEKLYYKSGDTYVEIATAPAELKKFVKYTHTSYLAVYNSKDKETRSLVSAKGYDGTATVYDANGNEVQKGNLFIKQDHSGIKWSKDKGIGIDLIFDNPNTAKAPDFSIHLGLDATLVMKGEAIEVEPYALKKKGAKLLEGIQEIEGYYNEGTEFEEIPVAEVYTGTRYDKDGTVNANGKYRKELVGGTETDHTLVKIKNVFSEVPENVTSEKIYLSMELGLKLSGTKGTNDSILDFIGGIIDISNRGSNDIEYYPIVDGIYVQANDGTFKAVNKTKYEEIADGEEYTGDKYVKNEDGTFTKDNENGTYKAVSVVEYVKIEDGEIVEDKDRYKFITDNYAGHMYSQDGALKFKLDANGTFKRGAYYLAEKEYVGTKFTKNINEGVITFKVDANGLYKFVGDDSAKTYFPILPEEAETYPADKKYIEDGKGFIVNDKGAFKAGKYVVTSRDYDGVKFRLDERTKDAETKVYFLYDEGLQLFKQGNYYKLNKDEVYNGVKFKKLADGSFAIDENGEYKFVAEEGAYYPVLEKDGYTGKLYRETEDPDAQIRYIEDVIYKFTPAFSGKDLTELNKVAKLLVSIGAYEDEARIRLTVGADIAELIKALSDTKNIDIPALISKIELAIESLDTKGQVKGGIYLYNSNLYIKYIDSERGIFAMPMGDIIGALAKASADGERQPFEAAMLQLWVGEFTKLNGAYTTGVAVKATTTLVERLLEVLLGFDEGTISLDALGGVDLAVTIETASPIFPENADGKVYVKKAGEFVELTDGMDLSDCEGYDPAYPDALTTRYTKVGEVYEELKFGFDFDSFGIGIGLKIGQIGFNLNIGKIDLGFVDDKKIIVPEDVKKQIVPEEAEIDLSMEVNIGVLVNDKHNNNSIGGFDLGEFIDNLGVLSGVNLGKEWLKLKVPDGGAELELTLRVALSLNITNLDHSVAAVEIVGRIREGGNVVGEKVLVGVYYKDGNALVKLEGLGFDNVRVSGLKLSSLLGASNGIELIKKLKGGGNGASTALASELGFTVAKNDDALSAAALVFDHNRIAVEVGTLFINGLLDIAALGLDNNTKAMLQKLDLQALVEVNYGDKFDKIADGEVYTGTRYFYDETTHEYYIDANGEYKRSSNISLRLNAEAADLIGISVAIENIKIGNTGVKETVAKEKIEDYAELIELLIDSSTNKIVGFEPKLEALTLSLDIDLGALFTDGMWMGRTEEGVDATTGKPIITNVSSVGAVGSGNMGIRASVKLELALAAILNKLEEGFDSSDIFKAIEEILPLVKAQISIYAQSDGDELVGIYVADGNVYLMLDGLGMPNVKVTGEFLMKVIRTATGSGTALASGGATASNAVASADANQIIGILKKLIAGVELGGKALKVAFQNDYFATLIDTMFSLLLNKDIKYYNKVLPEPNVAFSGLTVNLGDLGENYEPIYRKDGKYYTDSSCNEEFRYYGMVFNKNPQTQHIELYSEKEFVQQYVEGYAGMTAEELENAIKGKTTFYRSTRKGLVELDLDAYATHLKLAVNFPKIGAKKDLITSPNVGGVVFSDAEEVNGLALGIKGQIKINKQEGIALANILSGVVGDLETKLVIKDDIDIRFAIEAKVGIKYDLEDKTFGLNAIDLRVSLSRYYDPNNIVPLATLTYISSEGALYVDVSHFFKKQNEGNNKNIGMLKITGVNILDILNGLITGAGSSATVALGSADGSAWADEARTYIYYEANSMNSVAPDRYAKIHTLTDTDEVKKVYKNYTGEIVDYKTNDGRTLYVRDRDNKVTGYSVLSAENAEKFAFKAKYTHEVVTEFEKLNNLYIVSEYVKDANGTYKRGAYDIAEEGYTGTKFAMEADGTFKVDANGTYKFVANDSATTYYPILAEETYEGDKYQADKYVRIADDTADFTNTKLYKKLIKYVEITAGETVPESDRYNLVDGKYVQANDGKYKAVDKYVEVADGSASYIMEYNPKTCKYDFNVYDKNKPSHNAPQLYHYDEVAKKYAEGAGVDGATSYVKVPVYSISAVWADLTKYGIGDNVAGYDVKSNAKVNITGKAMLGLIGGLIDKGELEDILDALLVSIHATKDPFIFGLDIGILDVYNNHQLALNIGLNILGFDFEKGKEVGATDGSYLEFLDNEKTVSFLPKNADKYRQFADIDLDRILGAAEIMDVLIDSLDFGRSGKIFLNVSLDVDSFANDTGDNIVPWERYFAGLLGLNKDSAKVLYQVLFPEEELDGYGNFSIDIAAAIDVKNLLGGLLSGTGLNLEGTELRLTINMDTMLFAEDLREKNSKIVITAIGEADGILSVYIDNSKYRNKGKHVAKIDLNAILAGSSTSAQASASANTGLIPENIFGVLNALLGEVRLGDGRIYVGLRDNFIGELLNVLLGTSITEEESLVKGGVYIDLRNLEVGLEMILGDDDHTSDEDRDFYIGLRVGGIHLSAPDGFDTTANTFIKQEDRVDFVNIRKLKLDINFEAEWYYESSKQSGGFDISAFIDILETILKKELFPDKLVQFIVKEDEIDAVYTLALNAHIDLADFNNMKVAIEIYKATSTEPRDLKVGIYLDGQSLYADLSGWGLPKLKLAGLNLGDTINNALTPILDKYLIGDGTKRDASTSALASSYIDTYDKDFIEYSEFVEAEEGKYVLIYTESTYGNFVKVGEKYVRYSAKKHEGLTRYSRKVETYDEATHTNATRYNVSKGAFRTSWGKALFPVEYEESATGEFVLIDGKYVKYDSSNPAHHDVKHYKEISGGKPYVSLVLANNHFGFGINSDLLNSLLETITGALGLDIQLPNFGDAVMLFDSRKDINGDGMNDTQFNLVVQIDEHAYFGLRSSDFEISGNNSKANDAERKYNDRVASHSTEFAVAYDIASGEIGLENLALGFNVEIRQTCVDNGVSEFEQYLNVLLKSLLGIENFKLNLPKDYTIGCDIDLRVALNLKKLVSALQGGTDDWWSDIELYLDLKPFGYGSLVTLYKQKGDADVYADLSGLSLFKVKIIGLQSLIGGLVSGTASALASGDGTLRAPVAPSEKAILTVIPGKTGFKIEIGWGFIEGLLTSLLGDKVGDGTGELAGYKTITIGEGATATVIPLPKLNNERALTLSINHPSKDNGRDLELELALGFNNNDDSSIGIKIRNIVITDGAKDSSDYIRYGATKGAINTSGTNVLDAITGENANSFSGLILNDAKGLSLINILTTVVKGIDPAISIEWYKNTNHYYTNSKRESFGQTLSTIVLSRTNSDTTHIGGTEKTYAGKFQAIVKSYEKEGASNPREIGVWLFNNQLYIDITKTLNINLKYIEELRKMKVADLDILGLLGGLGSASSTALASDDTTTTEKSLKETVSGFVNGIEVNWWNNQSVVGPKEGSKDISTIRVDLNADGLNTILAKVYYLLYGMYNTSAPAAEMFSDDELNKMVYTEGQDVTLKDGSTVKSVNAHEKCVVYLQTYAANLIGETVSILKNALKPGGRFWFGFIPIPTGDVLREIIGRLLPLPKLDGTLSNYAEIVIDKTRLAGGKGVLKEIALSINKERTETSGDTFKRVTCGQNSAEIVIKFDDNVTLRSVSGVRNYDNGSEFNKDIPGGTIVVANPFDPVELTSAALNSNPALLKRVVADFHGISDYDSKSQKGVSDSYAELGGTPIVWDTSTAVLAPGEISEIWGYALNYKVQKVTVEVAPNAGFSHLFGYFKADGKTFVETNKIIVDPTKDPTSDDNVTAGLPRIIAIMRRDGELQVLSRDFDKDKPATVKINGVDYTVDGKFNWIDEDTVEEGATMEKAFWYQVGYSSRIQKTIRVKYNNVSVVSGSLPTEGVYDILNGGTAFDFTNEKHLDIIGNLGLPSIKANSKFTENTTDGTITYTYIGVDGSTYTFTKGTAPTDETELAEWNKHTLGGNGTFTRSFNGKVLQSGTYTYVAAESAAAGILDSLGGLFGGSGANTDSGKYALSVAIAPIREDATFTKNGDKFSYVGFDGSTYEFTPGTAPTDETELAEWNKHALGGNGKFTRSFNGNVLQSGTYVYVPAAGTEGKGTYEFEDYYVGLKEITVKLGTGKTTTVDVLEWKYDDFKYDMSNPQNGASGYIVAVINKYKITRTTGDLATTKLVNSKQEVKIPVSIAQETLSALADGNLNFNQYKDMFVLSATGDYVLETREVFVPFEEKNKAHEGLAKFALVNGKYVEEADSSVEKDNKARFVKQEVTGYVYDKYEDGKPTDNRYAINIFDAEELYVKVRRSRITFETQLFTVKDFAFYTDTLNMTDADQTPVNMFVVPELGVKTERNITVKALYKVNNAYEQVFDIKVVVTPKVATKVVLLTKQGQTLDAQYFESASATVAVHYNDGTVTEGLARDLIRLSENELTKIEKATEELGIFNGTVSVFKKGKYVEIKAGEVYEGKTYNRNGDVFTEAEEGTTGKYKFVEDETFVQNGVTFEIRVFSKN